MENFFYNNDFYNELSDLCNYMNWDEEEINSFEDDFKLEVNQSRLEPMFKIDSEWITERIPEHRFSEQDGDSEVTKIMKILDNNIDFNKINSLIPKAYYSTRIKHYFSKKDLLEAIS